MIDVSSEIKLNLPLLHELEENAVKALEMTADALLTEVKNAQVMPFDTGNLQNENTFVDYSGSEKGTVTLTSSTPYARRLYFHPEYNFRRYENAFAGGRWYDPWLSGGTRQNFCSEAFGKIYKRLCGL